MILRFVVEETFGCEGNERDLSNLTMDSMLPGCGGSSGEGISINRLPLSADTSYFSLLLLIPLFPPSPIPKTSPVRP